ncbi:hypothetical protein [Aliarcobacter butzleri]|uniref:hypothetical protein n=1 Tax=Aliarcobacter butzleri TaxID=28197 RepID=UPI003AF9B149
MKHEDIKFLPYKLPYNHNYKNYVNFINSNDVDFKKNDYYVYLISNPIKVDYSRSKNNYAIDVAILVQNKETKHLTIKKERFDFKSILQLNIFTKINDSGSVSLFESISNEFNSRIYETTIKIRDSEKCKILSLEQISKKFNILKKADINKLSYFKDLEFYFYGYKSKKILIPAIEILKYFYLYNFSKESNLKSHFCKNILTPNGIKNSLNKNDFDPIKQHYELELNGKYSSSDIYKILFFISNKKRLNLYSNVFNQYMKFGIISAKIPIKSLKFNARVLYYKEQDIYLVLNIVKHDFNRDIMQKFTCSYSHPNSKFKEEDKNKRDSSKDINKQTRINTELEINDKLYGNFELEYDEQTISDLKSNINFEEAVSTPINLNVKKTIDTKKQQQGGKVITDNTNLTETPLTTKDNYGNLDEAISIGNNEDNIVDYRDKILNEKLNLADIVKVLEEDTRFKFIDEKKFTLPILLNKNNQEIRRDFIYKDDKNKIKRSYYIIKFIYNKNKEVFIVELESKESLKCQKPILAIMGQNQKDISFINDEYIKKELTSLVNYSTRSWFSANIKIDKNYNYFTYAHKGNGNTFKEKLLSELEEL